MDDQQIFAACTRLRFELADWLETLTPEQLATPSLCAGWTVRDVSAHLTRVLTLSNAGLLLAGLRRGGNIHRANFELARAEGALPLEVQVGHLRHHAATAMRPPVIGARGPLTDLLVHTGDMRLPLGLPFAVEPEWAEVALDFLAAVPLGFVPRTRLKGLSFTDSRTGRTRGAGLEIRGSAEDLILAMCGRAVVLPRLTGPGRDLLAGRIPVGAGSG